MQTPGVAVSTSHYGDPGFYQPEVRGARAFDGDVDTAWEVGAHTKVIGEQLRLDLDQPITTDHVNLVQPQVGPNAALPHRGRPELRRRRADPRDARRRVAHADGSDGDVPVAEVLATRDHARRHQRGRQRRAADVQQRRLRRDPPARRRAGSEDVRADEIVRMPTDLVDAAGATAADRPLVYQMSRDRNVVVPPRYSEDETALVRRFRVPDKRVVRSARAPRVSIPPRPTTCSTRCSASATRRPVASRCTSSEHLPGRHRRPRLVGVRR